MPEGKLEACLYAARLDPAHIFESFGERHVNVICQLPKVTAAQHPTLQSMPTVTTWARTAAETSQPLSSRRCLWQPYLVTQPMVNEPENKMKVYPKPETLNLEPFHLKP